MFLRYFVELPLPARWVEDALLGSPATWLPGLVGDAGERGEGLLAEVGIVAAPLGPRLGRRVKVQLGEVVRLPSKVVLPMVWEPANAGALLPRLDADIEVGSLGPERTQVAISGRYTPPLGQAGHVIDRVLLHRVTEAAVKDFLDRVAAWAACAGSWAKPWGRQDVARWGQEPTRHRDTAPSVAGALRSTWACSAGREQPRDHHQRD